MRIRCLACREEYETVGGVVPLEDRLAPWGISKSVARRLESQLAPSRVTPCPKCGALYAENVA